LGELAKQDAKLLYENRWSANDADQLLRAVEAISSNLAEGYGRRSGAERARYYDYARATARESRDWYFKARHELGAVVFDARIAVLDRVIRILNAIIPRERGDGGRGRRRDPDP
jgi:four helix bundle protein